MAGVNTSIQKTGTGKPVHETSPTLVTPALGTPTSGILTNCTGSPTFTTVNATTFDTNVAAAGVTLAGTTLSADGSDADISITITPKGTGSVVISKADVNGGTVDATTIGDTTPGIVRGTNKEVFKTASADSPLTAAECSGTIVSNYGMTDADCVIDLPTAAEGLSFVCVLPAVRARYFRLKCPAAASDKIYLLGVAGSDDGYVGVASGYATGSAISMFTFKASDGGYDWFAIPIFGTWVAG